MSDIAEFITAQLDQDEQACDFHPHIHWRQIGDTGVIVASDGRTAEECANGNWAGVAEHIERHDPANVLADIAAKRALLKALQDNVRYWNSDDHTRAAAEMALEVAQCHIAAAYARRPGYKPEWGIDG